MKFICAFYTVLTFPNFLQRESMTTIVRKTLKILKYKFKFQNANLVISRLNEWVTGGGVARATVC